MNETRYRRLTEQVASLEKEVDRLQKGWRKSITAGSEQVSETRRALFEELLERHFLAAWRKYKEPGDEYSTAGLTPFEERLYLEFKEGAKQFVRECRSCEKIPCECLCSKCLENPCECGEPATL